MSTKSYLLFRVQGFMGGGVLAQSFCKHSGGGGGRAVVLHKISGGRGGGEACTQTP